MLILLGLAVEEKSIALTFFSTSGWRGPFSSMLRPLRLVEHGVNVVKPFHVPPRSPLHSGGVASHPVSSALVQVCCAKTTDEIKDLTRG